MDNPYTCDNCIYNPSQYRRLGSAVGYCLKHSTLLFKSNETTCRFHKRKDLPDFVCKEGTAEHAEAFHSTRGVVFYDAQKEVGRVCYSECHAWDTSTFDPNLNVVSNYHISTKKLLLIESLVGARSPVKSIMHSSFSRRYIQQCGTGQDNYRIALGVAYELGRTSDITQLDLISSRSETGHDDIYNEILIFYQKDIELLKLYCLQEYGNIVNDEEITWASDKLNGALEGSIQAFAQEIKTLGDELTHFIIEGAKKRGTYFKRTEPRQGSKADGPTPGDHTV